MDPLLLLAYRAGCKALGSAGFQSERPHFGSIQAGSTMDRLRLEAGMNMTS
jgi:hypothetical protein